MDVSSLGKTNDWYADHAILEELSVAGVNSRYSIRFNGPPEWYATEYDCPDCGVHGYSEGISFGEPNPELALVCHKSFNCHAWNNRLWRLWHHHTWGLAQRWSRHLWSKVTNIG